MDKQGEEDWWQRHKAERGVWSQGMLEALERGIKGGKWFSLIDKVSQERTLERAWEKVRSNAGSCGVDGITVDRFAKDSDKRLLAVREQIKKGIYQPHAIRRCWISKPGTTEKRPLGIPTIRDRVVQTALKMVIEPIFERIFAPQSHGFRPERSCKDALRRVEELLRNGHVQVVDIDIKGYFDSIDHDLLMKRIEEHIADGRVLEMVRGFLRAGVFDGLKSWEPEEGTPQGGVISPLLANIYLNPLDWLMKQAGLEMVRYADDMVVLCRDKETALNALEQIQQWMTDAKLTLHPEKTKVVSMTEPGDHFDFLGYRFWITKKRKLTRLVRPKSLKKLRATLKGYTKRCSGRSLEEIAAKVSPILRGWHGYFKHASLNAAREIDQLLRSRLRAILRKRRGRRGRARGQDHQRWPHAYFDRLGLYNLTAARHAEISNLRPRANC